MPEAGRRAAANQSSQPIQIRRPEGQAGDQTIDVGECGEPVMNAFAKRIAKNVAVFIVPRALRKLAIARGFMVYEGLR